MASIELTRTNIKWGSKETDAVDDTKLYAELDDSALAGYKGDDIDLSLLKIKLHHDGADSVVNNSDLILSGTKITSLGNNALKIKYTKSFPYQFKSHEGDHIITKKTKGAASVTSIPGIKQESFNNAIQIVAGQMIPNAVNLILHTFPKSFGYLDGQSIGCGFELYCNPDENYLAVAGTSMWDMNTGYTIRVNVAFWKQGDEIKFDSDPAAVDQRDNLEATIIHELTHIFTAEVLSAGYTGSMGPVSSTKFPGWFLEGFAKAVEGGYLDTNDWVGSTYPGMTTDQIIPLFDRMEARPTKNQTDGMYFTGYFMCMYLAYKAAGSPAVMNQSNMADGLDTFINEVKLGHSLDSLIQKYAGMSIDQFEKTFGLASNMDSVNFVKKLADTIPKDHATGGVATGFNTINFDLLPDVTASNLLFELDTTTTTVFNDYSEYKYTWGFNKGGLRYADGDPNNNSGIPIMINSTVELTWEGQFIIFGCRMIFNMEVQYVGPEVGVSREVPTQDIIVTLIRADYDNHDIKVREILGPDEYLCIDPGLIITNIGDNPRTIIYDDKRLNYWECEIIIPGKKWLADFDAQYIGPVKFLGEPVFYSEVSTIASWVIEYKWETGDIVTEERPLTEEEIWTFVTEPIIRKENNGIFQVQYEDIIDDITVPYKIPEGIYTIAWYEGPDIPVGNTYNKSDVVILLILDEKWENRRRLSYLLDHITFDDTVVNNAGWNLYYTTFSFEGGSYKQWFCVKGYIPPVYPLKDFQVIYKDPKNNRWIDMTDMFRPKFTFDGAFVISWKQFSVEVSEIMLYGIYILTAPPEVGLSARITEDWEVRCINSTTLKARVLKSYHKEEDLTWQEEKRTIITWKQWQEENLSSSSPQETL